MSIYDSIMKASNGVRRSLFDHSVKLTGREVSVIHFSVQEDKYGDETITILGNKTITVRINYPEEVPLERKKDGTLEVKSDTDRTYFFDVLPIELFSRWEDQISTGDFIVHFLENENDNLMPIILRTSEFLGSFTTGLVWSKFFCSPFRGILPTEVRTIIEGELNA